MGEDEPGHGSCSEYNTFPLHLGPEGIGDGIFYDRIPDGEAWQFQGYDENDLPRSLNGRLTERTTRLVFGTR